MSTLGNYEGGKREGLWWFGPGKYGHYIHGVLYTIEEGSYDENGQKTGEWKYYDKDGYLEESGNYEDGIKQGDWIYYDKYSFPIKIESYRNGKVISRKEFYAGGVVKKEQVEDEIKHYDETGTLKSSHKLLNMQGYYVWEYTNYYPNGKVKSIEYYSEDGVKTGNWKYFDENGNLIKTENF